MALGGHTTLALTSPFTELVMPLGGWGRRGRRGGNRDWGGGTMG